MSNFVNCIPMSNDPMLRPFLARVNFSTSLKFGRRCPSWSMHVISRSWS